jgi:hypothetical protein
MGIRMVAHFFFTVFRVFITTDSPTCSPFPAHITLNYGYGYGNG